MFVSGETEAPDHEMFFSSLDANQNRPGAVSNLCPSQRTDAQRTDAHRRTLLLNRGAEAARGCTAAAIPDPSCALRAAQAGLTPAGDFAPD